MDTELDYFELGLKCGLEIHQQLDTRKLFCHCPSLLRKDKPNYEIKRKLHAVAGELGNIDIAAKYQTSLDKEFIYQGYDSVCLVELDEEPPHQINPEALEITLKIALLLNCKILPITQIMRKTVIDGSNTSGFQRTVLIATNGFVDTKYGRVKVESVCLEEDAARIIGKKDKSVIYRLDRLGIPLVEIATAPDIKTPEQAKEVALHIGDILRSCKVKRGLGTIRQDVNVSIKNGNRVEIKGFQDIKNIEKAIDCEVKRQFELIKEKKPVKKEVRNVLSDGKSEFLRPLPGSARMYPETDLPLLKISKKMIDNARRTLPELRKVLKKKLIEKGLNEEMIKLLFKKNKIDDFKSLLNVYNNPKLVAKIMLIFPKEIAKHKNKELSFVEKIFNYDTLEFILEALEKKKINEHQVKEVLERIVEGEKPEKAIIFKEINLNEIEEDIVKIIKEKPGLSEKAYMGLVMKEFKGKISGKDAMNIIKKYIS